MKRVWQRISTMREQQINRYRDNPTGTKAAHTKAKGNVGYNLICQIDKIRRKTSYSKVRS